MANFGYPQQPIFQNHNHRRNGHHSSHPMKTITRHCNTINSNADTISTTELTDSLDELLHAVKHLKNEQQAAGLFDIVSVLAGVNSKILVSVARHHFFTLLQIPLLENIRQWCDDSYLNEDDVFMFRNLIKLLKILSKNTSGIGLAPLWLTDSSVLEAIGNCITDISEVNTFFDEKAERESKNFTRLFTIYANYQNRLNKENFANKDELVQLIDPVINCLTSNYYVQSFETIRQDSKKITTKAKFFLIKCPTFLTTYTGPRLEEIMEKLLTTMLPKYITILDRITPSIHEWKHNMMRAVNSMLEIVSHGSTNEKIIAKHLPFIDHLLNLIDKPILYNDLHDTLSNPETILINSAINLLAQTVNEPEILAHIKQRQVTSTFLRLTSAQYEPLVHNVYQILAYTTSEDDIKTMQNSGALVSTIIKSLKSFVDRPSNNERQCEQLLTTFKGLVQHDQMKGEVVKQNSLQFLLECTNKLSRESLTLLLEALWSLSFFHDAALTIRSDTQFLEKVETMSKTTTDEGMKKAADGLAWKLVREPAFLEKVAENNAKELTETYTETIIESDGKEKVVTKTRRASTVGERVFPYDMMISYCHADKDLIYKIHQFLLDQGFKIWIDLNNMFGPAMNAMAEAVENSEFVLLCMSDSYKQSTYCQAEAEYAFNCKRRLLPLIVRPGFKADGWLGFMIGSRIYVDFGRFDFETACEKLMNEINLQRKRPLPSKVEQSSQPPKPVVTARKESVVSHRALVHFRGVPDLYMNRESRLDFKQKHIDMWTESDVLDFLFNNELKELMPLCERMNGRALTQLYIMCRSNHYKTYTLLNTELKATYEIPLPIGIYTRFLSFMERVSLLPPRLPPLPPPPQFNSEQFNRQQFNGEPYDILINSAASTSEVIKMADVMISQRQGKSGIQRQRRHRV